MVSCNYVPTDIFRRDMYFTLTVNCRHELVVGMWDENADSRPSCGILHRKLQELLAETESALTYSYTTVEKEITPIFVPSHNKAERYVSRETEYVDLRAPPSSSYQNDYGNGTFQR